MTVHKVCPVVLRSRGAQREILAFSHPQAGCQLVKGWIDPGESIEAAALRELEEESGIAKAAVTRQLGVWESGHEGQVWAFVECQPADAPNETWSHWANDDGGHTFTFFWHPLNGPTDDGRWHPLFQAALAFVKKAL